MPEVLFYIPLTLWIRETIGKMNRFGKTDIQSWCDYWLTTYEELGGRSFSSGSKVCPKYAAYGLWQLGRIKDTDIPFQQMSIEEINQKYGKNAAYAVLAVGLLDEGQAAMSKIYFWIRVRELYKSRLNEEPAGSEQGEITLARILFEEDQIVSEQG